MPCYRVRDVFAWTGGSTAAAHRPGTADDAAIHEAPRLTGEWRVQIGRTHCFTAAHDGPELALVRFDPDDLENATRELL